MDKILNLKFLMLFLFLYSLNCGLSAREKLEYQGILVLTEPAIENDNYLPSGVYIKLKTYIGFNFKNIEVDFLEINKKKVEVGSILIYDHHLLLSLKNTSDFKLDDSFKLNIKYEYEKIEHCSISIINGENFGDYEGINYKITTDKELLIVKIKLNGEVKKLHHIYLYSKLEQKNPIDLSLNKDKESGDLIYSANVESIPKLLSLSVLSNDKSENTQTIEGFLFKKTTIEKESILPEKNINMNNDEQSNINKLNAVQSK